jgi:predicted secreted protein
MGWEKRGNGLYYYRKRRIGDTVVSEYVGRGKLAELIATLDALEQEEREAEREAWRQRQAEITATDQVLDEVERVARALTRAYLLADGYHTHKGQWRRRRENA